MADKVFAEGIYYDRPKPNAPNYILGNISMEKKRALEWLQAQEANERGYIRLTVKESRNGKLYIVLDNWEPQRGAPPSRPTPPQRPAPPPRRDDWAGKHRNTGYYPGPDGKPLPEEDGEFSDDVPF